MVDLRRLVLVGAGGHASDVLACLEAINAVAPTFALIGTLDDDADADARRLLPRGVAILGTLERIRELDATYVVSLGYPDARLDAAMRLAEYCDDEPATIVDPSVRVPFGVEIGAGAVVLDGAHISPFSGLGEHVLVSYGASVGHDATVGRGSSIMPHATVSGDVSIGQRVLIGAGATILQGVNVGDGAIVGAGAVVTADVAPDSRVVGIPAKPLRVRPAL